MNSMEINISDEDLWNDFNSSDSTLSKIARDNLIIKYQFLIIAAAKKLKAKLPPWVQEDDLISYGQIGLIKAVDTFDQTKSPSFRSFGYIKIYGAIMDEIRTQDWAPRGLRKDERLLNAAKKQLQSDNPSPKDLGEELGWSTERVVNTVQRVTKTQHQSLDGVYDQIADEDDTSYGMASDLCDKFAELIEEFPIEHQVVIVRRYFLNQKLSIVAEETDIPLTVVRKIHAEAIARILDEMTEAIT